MHPSQIQLQALVDGSADTETRDRLERHLADCELCREFVTDYGALRAAVVAAKEESLPDRARELVPALLRAAERPRLIRLLSFEVNGPAGLQFLAADGVRSHEPMVRNVATLYADNPEVVLRVMRDNRRGRTYLQLISDDLRPPGDVLIQSPELNRNFVTDPAGHADLGDLSADRLAQATWQLRMPDAVFKIEPASGDPDLEEDRREVILESDRRDRIRVVFDGRAEDRQLFVEVLELEGREAFESCIVSVSQLAQVAVLEAGPGQAVSYRLADDASEVRIRLFS
jgi:hypothetical protein